MLVAASVIAFDIQVENATGYDLLRLHVYSHDAKEIGPNVLQEPMVIGESRRLTVPDSTERLLAIDNEGDQYLVLGLGPRERTRIILGLDDLFFGDPVGAGTVGGVTLINETGYDLVSVVVLPVAEGRGDSGVELLPPAQRVPRGRSFILRVPESLGEDYLFHLIVTDAEGDLYERRRIDFRRERSVSFTVDDIRW